MTTASVTTNLSLMPTRQRKMAHHTGQVILDKYHE
jgi:hypothetical protein